MAELKLCPLCVKAGHDRYFGLYAADPQTGRYPLCCMGRAVAASPRKHMRAAFDGLTAELSPDEAQAVRERAYQLMGIETHT